MSVIIGLLILVSVSKAENVCETLGYCGVDGGMGYYDADGHIDCWRKCAQQPNCKFYSYNSASTWCQFFDSCDNLNFNETLWTTGDRWCSPDMPTINYRNLLVATGFNGEVYFDDVETFDLSNDENATSCKNLPPQPREVYSAVGGVVDPGYPVICGGYFRGIVVSKCAYLDHENMSWIEMEHGLNTSRRYAASVVLPNQNHSLLVTGGVTENYVKVDTAEWISFYDSRIAAFSMPEAIYLHCVVAVNESTIMIIGGQAKVSGNCTSKSRLYNIYTDIWTDGPDLDGGRKSHACGTFRNETSGLTTVVVAGGHDCISGSLNSTLYWEEGSSTWTRGPDLPTILSRGSIVSDHKGRLVLVGSYNNICSSLGKFLRLDCIDCIWIELTQSLKIPRRYLVAMTIPEKYVDCQYVDDSQNYLDPME